MSAPELSYLSRKTKMFFATILLLAGTGCAALFPPEHTESTSENAIANTANTPFDLFLTTSSPIPVDSTSPVPPDSLAVVEPVFGNKFEVKDTTENTEENEYHLAQPDSPYGKYYPAPSMEPEQPKASPQPRSSIRSSGSSTLLSQRIPSKLDTYNGIEEPELSRTAVEVSPLQRWNNLFETPPPLNELTKSQQEWLGHKKQDAEKDRKKNEEEKMKPLIIQGYIVPYSARKPQTQSAPIIIPNGQIVPYSP